jgi:transcriptional regulator with XRE-family HTH domain
LSTVSFGLKFSLENGRAAMYHVDMSEGNMAVTIKRIEDLMRAKNMSSADIMRAGNIDKSTLSNILSGKRSNPSSRSLEKIARGLGTTLDYLRGNTENPYPVDGQPMPDFGLDMLEAMRQLPRSRNYELLVIARAFIESHAQITSQTVQELKDYLLDYGDGVLGESATDELLRRLDAFGSGDTTDAYSGTSSEESDQPGDNDT